MGLGLFVSAVEVKASPAPARPRRMWRRDGAAANACVKAARRFWSKIDTQWDRAEAAGMCIPGGLDPAPIGVVYVAGVALMSMSAGISSGASAVSTSVPMTTAGSPSLAPRAV